MEEGNYVFNSPKFDPSNYPSLKAWNESSYDSGFVNKAENFSDFLVNVGTQEESQFKIDCKELDDLLESSDDDLKDIEDEEKGFQKAYDELFAEAYKLKKENLSLISKVNFAEKEIDSLKEEMTNQISHVQELNNEKFALHNKFVCVKNDNDKLSLKIVDFQKEVKSLEKQLEISRETISKLSNSSKKLDHILNVGKSPCDKSGLGYTRDSSNPSTSGTKFVPSSQTSLEKENCITKTPIRTTSICHLCGVRGHIRPGCPKLGKTHENKSKVQQPKSVTCHLCGVKGHIRPQCPKLRKGTSRQPYDRISRTPHVGTFFQKTQKSTPKCHNCGVLGHVRPYCLLNKETSHVKSFDKFVPTCHLCGKKGHIKPHCFHFKQYSYSWNKDTHPNWFRRDYRKFPRVSKNPRTQVDLPPKKKNVIYPRKSTPTVKKALSYPKVKTVWIRKENLISLNLNPSLGKGSSHNSK